MDQFLKNILVFDKTLENSESTATIELHWVVDNIVSGIIIKPMLLFHLKQTFYLLQAQQSTIVGNTTGGITTCRPHHRKPGFIIADYSFHFHLGRLDKLVRKVE